VDYDSVRGVRVLLPCGVWVASSRSKDVLFASRVRVDVDVVGIAWRSGPQGERCELRR